MLDDDQKQVALRRGRDVLRAEVEAIRAAETHLGNSFVEAVEAILDSPGRVCVTGVGKAGLVGDKIQATLSSTGTYAYSLHPVEALHGDLGMVHPNDVVLGLSKSGGSELALLLPILREFGCRVILLTASPSSPAAQHADIVLNIGDAPEACPLGLAPSSSTSAMLALGDALALALMELRSFQPEDYAERHPSGALGRSLMRTHEIMRRDDDCPTVRAGATIAQCYETILKAPRRAGAAMVVDDGDRLVGILTQGDFFRFFEHPEGFSSRSVEELMTRDPQRVADDALVADALVLMRQAAIDELPVVDSDGRVLGLIDIQDLIARGFSVFDPF